MMASGSQSTSTDPIEPTRVWTREEWLAEQPWGDMPGGDLRLFFKNEGFIHMYSGGPNKFRDLYKKYESNREAKGRFIDLEA